MLIVYPEERISWKKLVNHEIFMNNAYFNSIKSFSLIDIRFSTLKKIEN